VLNGLTPASFLRRHWQKRPLLIRQALPGLRSFITPEELAGLSCEEDIHSRLVVEKAGKHPWQVTHGPLQASDFRRLPPTHWTLLVSDVDKVMSAAAALLERFTFLPGWRIDDLMVSYAADQGGVGPHVDSYDVFLLQAQGRRRWRISSGAHPPEDFVPGLDLRILRNFAADQEWVLEPGDMLYLPPGVAHDGVAEGACMTYSVGFRAPTHRELLTGFAEYAAAQLDAEARYRDRDFTPQRHSGEISAAALRRVRRCVRAIAADGMAIDDWFGRYVTETGPWRAPRPPTRPLSPAQFRQRWWKQRIFRRSETCRYAFIRHGKSCILYVDGNAFPLPRSLAFAAALLSDRRVFEFEALRHALQRKGLPELLCELYNKGYLRFNRQR
jgi:50S ribosomal protein L16 3-hydroxylase